MARRRKRVVDGDTTLCLAVFDLDHFKEVNDRCGHAAGDEVLRVVSEVLGGVLRAGDAVVRYGGEEFLLVLPHVSLDHAVAAAERARAALERARIPVGSMELRINASFGVAQRRGGEARGAVISRADDALYRAKAAGRNCVMAAE